MNYEQAMEYIHKVKWQGSKPGLSRTRELLAMLGNPEKKLKFVHIAGTNGKGSTAACCESILRQAGYKTGLYTSPYLIRFNERMQVCGQNIDDDHLARIVTEISPFADSMTDAPTEFELITALAMKYFYEMRCDIVVLEVGLGGELDSTNVIDTPESAVITAIGLDHTAVLGNTLAEIASAKAGIIKKCGDVAVYGGPREVTEVFENRAQEMNASLSYADFNRILDIHFNINATCFTIFPYGEISLPLIGTYQPKNALLAVTAIEILRKRGWKISNTDIINGLNNVHWPGRFEILRKMPYFILDGAHNPHGIIATLDSFNTLFDGKKAVFVIGVMADKDTSEMIRLLSPFAQSFIAVRPNNPRAMSAEKLAFVLAGTGVSATPFHSMDDAVIEAINRAGQDGIVFALGSLYFSSDIRSAVIKTI